MVVAIAAGGVEVAMAKKKSFAEERERERERFCDHHVRWLGDCL